LLLKGGSPFCQSDCTLDVSTCVDCGQDTACTVVVINNGACVLEFRPQGTVCGTDLVCDGLGECGVLP